MNRKWLAAGLLLVLLVLTSIEDSLASFTILSQESVDIEVKGYDGLTENVLFKGNLTAGTQQTIDTSYKGLALLESEHGQVYPVILGKQSFTMNLKDRDSRPAFTGSDENTLFYKMLTGVESGNPDPGQYGYVFLMIQAKELLDSSHSIRTVDELNAMKEKFYAFVRTHYQQLQYSDMLRQLIGQYFMMHEYVNFHVKGAPATDILVRYKKAVLDGAGKWLDLLKPHMPEHEVLNYCVSLYFNRSMVNLAHLIVSRYKDAAYCPGTILNSVDLPENSVVTDANENRKGTLEDFRSNGVIAYVSCNCPVSMVETVFKARRLATRKNGMNIIVVPVGGLSDRHLSMRRMLTTDNMLFVNDETCCKIKDIRLPLFVGPSQSTPSRLVKIEQPPTEQQ